MPCELRLREAERRARLLKLGFYRYYFRGAPGFYRILQICPRLSQPALSFISRGLFGCTVEIEKTIAGLYLVSALNVQLFQYAC